MIGFKWHIVTAVLVLSSLSGGFSQSLDSLDVSMSATGADTIALSLQTSIDSLHKATDQSYRELKQSYDSIAQVAASGTMKLQHRIDSLTTLNVSTGRLTQKLDSIASWRSAKLDSITNRVVALQAGVNERLNSLQLPPEVQQKATGWLAKVNSFDQTLPINNVTGDLSANIPQLNVPGIDNPLAQTPVPLIPDLNLPGVQTVLPDASLPAMPEMNIPSGNIGNLADPLAPVQQQVAGVVPADINNVPDMLEQRLTNLPETAAMQEQINAAGELNALPVNASDPEAMKDQAISEAKKLAKNHFAGREEQLQQAMEKLATYKKKYYSVESIAELPEKAPNPLRRKPFVERLVPGIALQVGRNDHWMVDFNPYVGFRFYPRLTAGIGWNHRVAYSTDAYTFVSQVRVYGPRVYGEYKLGKGFHGRLELEYMNTYVPARFASKPDSPDGREWVFGVMAGMKKDYRITRKLKGTIVMMYNLYDPHHRSPYGNRLNARVGVEYRMKVKKN